MSWRMKVSNASRFGRTTSTFISESRWIKGNEVRARTALYARPPTHRLPVSDKIKETVLLPDTRPFLTNAAQVCDIQVDGDGGNDASDLQVWCLTDVRPVNGGDTRESSVSAARSRTRQTRQNSPDGEEILLYHIILFFYHYPPAKGPSIAPGVSYFRAGEAGWALGELDCIAVSMIKREISFIPCLIHSSKEAASNSTGYLLFDPH